MLLVFVISNATGDITGHRFRGVVEVQPLHMTPGSLSPDEIIYPEQRPDKKRSQGYRYVLQQPDRQGMPPCRALVVAAR